MINVCFKYVFISRYMGSLRPRNGGGDYLMLVQTLKIYSIVQEHK